MSDKEYRSDRIRILLYRLNPICFIFSCIGKISDRFHYRGLEKSCWYCEMLGLCRDRNNKWIFRENGCYLGEEGHIE